MFLTGESWTKVDDEALKKEQGNDGIAIVMTAMAAINPNELVTLDVSTRPAFGTRSAAVETRLKLALEAREFPHSIDLAIFLPTPTLMAREGEGGPGRTRFSFCLRGDFRTPSWSGPAEDGQRDLAEGGEGGAI